MNYKFKLIWSVVFVLIFSSQLFYSSQALSSFYQRFENGRVLPVVEGVRSEEKIDTGSIHFDEFIKAVQSKNYKTASTIYKISSQDLISFFKQNESRFLGNKGLQRILFNFFVQCSLG